MAPIYTEKYICQRALSSILFQVINASLKGFRGVVPNDTVKGYYIASLGVSLMAED
jgi:hypothetical protein